MPSVPVQPTGSQNPQNTAVENQSIGHGLFEGWVVVEKGDACIKDLHEKVRSGFSPGRSIGCARYAVKEGISAFSQKPFGKKSKAPTCSSGVEMSPVASENKHAASVPKKQHNGGNPSGSVGKTERFRGVCHIRSKAECSRTDAIETDRCVIGEKRTGVRAVFRRKELDICGSKRKRTEYAAEADGSARKITAINKFAGGCFEEKFRNVFNADDRFGKEGCGIVIAEMRIGGCSR